MSKRPLLRGKLAKPAAALILSVLLPVGFAGIEASAEGESAKPAASAADSNAPGAGTKSKESVKQPAGESPKAASADAKPADANATKPQPGEQPAEPKEAKAEAKSSDSKAESHPAEPKDVKAEAKPSDSTAASHPAEPKDAKAEAKPSDSKTASHPTEAKELKAEAKPEGSKPEGQPAEPKDAAAESKPAAKPAEAGSGPLSSAPKEAKADPKPGDAKPNAAAKPAEPKEAAASAKPRDLTPKTNTPESLAIRASTVNAVYHIHFLGAHIGDFKIRSSITNRQYALQANADISVFFGSVSWQGATSSHGLMTANGPVPQNYTFRYATNDRREAVEIRFQQRMVQDILINPPVHPGSRNVPITAADLQNVVDPLSAVVLLSQVRLSRNSGDACNKRLPIFDGRIRYDLVLSPKGTRSIGNSGRLRGTAYVCRVSYVPIAGHKLGKQGDYATGNTGIEIWLVPVPEAGLLVPYYVHVPTPAGTASMVTAKFDVETPSGRHALAD